MKVITGDGKYTFIQHPDGSSEALRHGLPWRDCTGDNLVFCLAQDVDSLRCYVAELKGALNDLVRDSYGVAGLHLNGDVAPWSELLSGGRFEE